MNMPSGIQFWKAHLNGANGLPSVVHDRKGRQPLIAHRLAAAFLRVHQPLADSLGLTAAHTATGAVADKQLSWDCLGGCTNAGKAVTLSCPGIAWKAAQRQVKAAMLKQSLWIYTKTFARS